MEAEGCGLPSIGPRILDDQCVRQSCRSESFGKAPKRLLVRHRERNDDRWRVPGGLTCCVSCLSDLYAVGEVGADQRIEDLGGSNGVGRSRRACALTLDAWC